MAHGLRVYLLVARRAPRFTWNVRRVAQAVADTPGIDHSRVAADTADFLEHEATRVRDHHGALRAAFRRAHDQTTPTPEGSTAHAAYDRLD